MEYLRATSDDEIGKIGPSPSASTPAGKDRVPGTPGCGGNRAILRCHPQRWIRHNLRIPPRLHLTDENLSAGAPVLARFSSATPPARRLITGSNLLGRLPSMSQSNPGKQPELIIGYEREGPPNSAVCSLCGEWMAQESPRFSNLKDVITSFEGQFRIHVRTKHPHLRE